MQEERRGSQLINVSRFRERLCVDIKSAEIEMNELICAQAAYKVSYFCVYCN